MKNIAFIKNFVWGRVTNADKPKEVKEIFNGPRCRLMSVELRDNEFLPKHAAIEPITVFCLAGNGTFRAGEDLADEQQLVAGTLLTLAGGVAHEVVAEPDLSLLVTKFKAE